MIFRKTASFARKLFDTAYWPCGMPPTVRWLKEIRLDRSSMELRDISDCTLVGANPAVPVNHGAL